MYCDKLETEIRILASDQRTDLSEDQTICKCYILLLMEMSWRLPSCQESYRSVLSRGEPQTAKTHVCSFILSSMIDICDKLPVFISI